MGARVRSKIAASVALAVAMSALAEAQDDDGPVLLRDVVVECRDAASGAPLAGCEVFVLSAKSKLDSIAMAMGGGVSARRAAMARGARHVADNSGLVRARVPLGEAALFGIADGRIARLPTLGDQYERFVLDFVALPQVRARVHGPDGEPTAGVEVALWRLWINRIDSLSSRTDEDGMAHFYPTHARWNLDFGDDLYCGVVGVFARPLEVGFRSDALPAETIEFRLPPHGNVALVRSIEEPRRTLSVRLRDPAATGRSFELQHPCEPRGSLTGAELTLGPVELGVAFEADAPMPGSHARFAARGVGPAVAGGTTRVTLARDAVLRLQGRAVDGRGAPMGGAALDAVLVEFGALLPQEEAIPLSCDEAGNFVWELRTPLAEPVELVLRSRTPSEPLAATLPWSPAQGNRHLGDVRFAPPPRIVAGRIVDEGGTPLAGVRVTVIGGSDTNGERTLHAARQLVAITDERGHFDIRSPFRAPPTIFVMCDSTKRSSEMRRVPTGTDLGDVALVSKASLRGRLLLDADVPADRLGILVAGRAVPVGPSGAFFHDDIRAGRHTVELGGPGWLGPAVALFTAEFEPGSAIECGELDATGTIAKTRLRVRGVDGVHVSRLGFEWEPEGNSAEVAALAIAGVRPPPATGWVTSGADHAVEVLHRSRGVDGRLIAKGHRPYAISLRGGEVDVDLRHALIVEIRATDPGSALPTAVILADASGVGSPLVEWVDEDGVARFEPPSPGLWRVRVQKVPGTLDPDAHVGTIVVEDVVEPQSFDVRRRAGR